MLTNFLCLILTTPSVQAACSSTCLTCTSNPNVCLTCKDGYFLHPGDVGLCYTYCPTGYSWNTVDKRCDGSPGIVVDYVLDSIAPIFYDKHRGWPAQNGNTNTYYKNPTNFEPSDPIPTKGRGYHFDGVSQYVALLPMAGQPGNMPLIGSEGSIFIWVMLEEFGDNALFAQNYPSSGINYLLFFAADYKLYGNLLDTDIKGKAVITKNVWHNALFTFQYSPSTGTTDAAFYLNLMADSTASLATRLIVDINGVASIGQDYDPGFEKTDFFKGCIWQVTLYNYAISYQTYQDLILGPGQPASAAFTLSTCSLNQYIDEEGNCANCLPSCAAGCVNGQNCDYCADYKCTNCTSFETGSCVACINNLVAVDGECICSVGYYYDISSNSCLNCDETCFTCKLGNNNDCMSCKSGAVLREGPPGECACSSTHFAFPDARNCQPCDFTCATCKGPGPNRCLTCEGEATLIGSLAGTCVCPPSAMQQLQPRCVKKSASVQLTSADYATVFSSAAQPLLFPSSGEQLYIVPNLKAYSLLFWLQMYSPLPASTSILTLTTRGKEALTIRIYSGQIIGKSCSACGECVSLSIDCPNQAYKWMHIGVAVDGMSRSFTLTVAPWKQAHSSASGVSSSPLLVYDSSTSNLSIGGFSVSCI